MCHEDLARAVAIATETVARERWSSEELIAHQQAALRNLVAHAVRHSPFHRERLDPDAPLEALPVLEKSEVMERWDDVVCDRRLSLAHARTHLADLTGDDYLAGEFRIVATGGSSRVPGIFAFDREAWAQCGALMLRAMQRMEALSSGPGDRFAVVAPIGAWRTMTSRLAAMFALADERPEDTLHLDITRPVAELVSELNAYQPARLLGYPSMIGVLAAEQLDGRLDISPRHVTTSSEPQTPAVRARIEAAWGTVPHNIWAMTESSGLISSTCPHGRGLHLAEDTCIVEIVDDDLRPVPPGHTGSRVLLTNLVNFTMPLIRYVINDRVTVAPEPCTCGRTTRLIDAVDGRSDDVLRVPAAAGGTVDLHPLAWMPLASHPAVADFRVVHTPDALSIDVVLRGGEPVATAEHVVRELLADRGVGPHQHVVVAAHDHLPRSAQGKLKLIDSRVSQPMEDTTA